MSFKETGITFDQFKGMALGDIKISKVAIGDKIIHEFYHEPSNLAK